MENILYYALPPIAIICIVFLTGLYTVKQNSAVIIERFGKFKCVKHAGLHFKLIFADKIAEKFNLKVQQLEVPVETKTKENIFVTVFVSVQYKLNAEKVYEAYCFDEPYEQLSNLIYNIIRAELPKLKLNEAFENKDVIAESVHAAIQEQLLQYGYEILQVLTTDIEPDTHVKNALNRINAADLEKSAAEFEAEALRINMIAKAKAEAEKKRLEGQAIADQRREIAKGLMESVDALGKAGISSAEASALLMLTQHYETLQSIGGDSKSNLILMPNSAQDSKEMISSMLASFGGRKEEYNEYEDHNRKIIKFPNQQDHSGEFEVFTNQL